MVRILIDSIFTVAPPEGRGQGSRDPGCWRVKGGRPLLEETSKGRGGDSRGAGSEGPPSTEGWRWGIRRESCCRDRVKEFQTTLSDRLAKFALIELKFLGMVPWIILRIIYFIHYTLYTIHYTLYTIHYYLLYHTKKHFLTILYIVFLKVIYSARWKVMFL